MEETELGEENWFRSTRLIKAHQESITQCLRSTVPTWKHDSKEVAQSYLYDSHGLFLHRFFVPNDVRHTVLSYGDLTALYPLANDIRGAFVCAGLLVQGIKLLLEILYLIAVIFDLAFVLVVDGLHDLLTPSRTVHAYQPVSSSFCYPPWGCEHLGLWLLWIWTYTKSKTSCYNELGCTYCWC